MLFRITGTIIHHTTDDNCIAVDKTETIPPFFINGLEYNISTEQEVENIAKKIICPIELQHESVTIDVSAEKLDTSEDDE